MPACTACHGRRPGRRDCGLLMPPGCLPAPRSASTSVGSGTLGCLCACFGSLLTSPH